MTFYERLKGELLNNGLSISQATAIMMIVKEGNIIPDMETRWNHDIDGYPPIMLTIMWTSIRPTVLQWIDDNVPLAWFRPMFEA